MSIDLIVSTTPLRPAELHGHPLLQELSGEDLGWVCAHALPVDLDAGQEIFHEGADPDRFVVLLDGEIVITTTVDGREEVLARHDTAVETPPDRPAAASGFTGEMPLLAGVPYVATASAGRSSRLAVFDAAGFAALLERCPQVCRVLLPVLAWRLHSSSMQAGQRATLTALGTLAAGLAHELNNPASAVQRSVRELGGLQDGLLQAALDWGHLATAQERETLEQALLELTPLTTGQDSAVARSRREDELTDLVEDTGLTGSAVDLLVEGLLDRQDAPAFLDRVVGQLPDDRVPAALALAGYRLAIGDEVTATADAAARISGIVAATRDYTNLDRAPEQDFDVAEGMESTLQMLGHRLSGVQVDRSYPAEPVIARGYPGELNQVWTNLVVNALDALEGRPEPTDPPHLAVVVQPEGGCVTVSVTDNGPGIPPEVRERIFEPFFTTKDIGKGTGLGLHLSHRIVTQRHQGSIAVESRPGSTRFLVRFPCRPDRGDQDR